MRRCMVFALAAACRAANDPTPTPVEPEPPTVDTDAPDDTDLPPTDTDLPSGDCAVPPPLPDPDLLEFRAGFVGGDDFDFDSQGRLITWDPTTGALMAYASDSVPTVLHSNLDVFGDCIQVLPNDDVLVCGGSTILKITAAGEREVLTTVGGWAGAGVLHPVTGDLFAAEPVLDEVWRIDTTTGAITDVLSASYVDGLAFSPDGDTLYLTGISEVVRATFGPAGQLLAAEVLFQTPQPRDFHGATTDVCGNLYLTDDTGSVWRVSPDGADVVRLAQVDATRLWGLRFGSGVGGWDTQTLYALEEGGIGRLFAISAGIAGQ